MGATPSLSYRETGYREGTLRPPVSVVYVKFSLVCVFPRKLTQGLTGADILKGNISLD